MLNTRSCTDIWQGRAMKSPPGASGQRWLCHAWWLCHLLPAPAGKGAVSAHVSPCEQRALSSGTGASPNPAPKQEAWVENRLLPIVPLAESPRSLLIPQVRKSNEDAVASHTKPFYCGRAFPHQELHTQTPGSGLSKHAKSPQRPVPTTPLEFKYISWQSWEYFSICFFLPVGTENIKYFCLCDLKILHLEELCFQKKYLTHLSRKIMTNHSW